MKDKKLALVHAVKKNYSDLNLTDVEAAQIVEEYLAHPYVTDLVTYVPSSSVIENSFKKAS